MCSNPKTGECLRHGDKIEPTSSTLKSIANKTATADPFMQNQNATQISTEHNPYENYSGEYGKQFNHYVQMGLNESDVQESIDKIVDMEIRHANEDLRQQIIEDVDGYIILDVSENEIHDLEPLKHPQYVSDHHVVGHHDESVAMVTVGCLILGMLVFLLAMVYIRRITRRLPASRNIDPEADLQKVEMPFKFEQTKTFHAQLPSKKNFYKKFKLAC